MILENINNMLFYINIITTIFNNVNIYITK
ncbi:hypothetical protein SPPR111872_23665 [Sphingobacterium prati]